MSTSDPSKAPPLGKAGLLFMGGMLVYSVFRALVVGKTLGEYGINPWVFLVLDAGSAVPLAWGQVRLVQGLKRNDPRLVQRSLIVVILSFIAPYAYLVLGAGRPLPTVAYVVIALLVVGVGVATVWRIRSEARRSPLTDLTPPVPDLTPSSHSLTSPPSPLTTSPPSPLTTSPPSPLSLTGEGEEKTRSEPPRP